MGKLLPFPPREIEQPPIVEEICLDREQARRLALDARAIVDIEAKRRDRRVDSGHRREAFDLIRGH